MWPYMRLNMFLCLVVHEDVWKYVKIRVATCMTMHMVTGFLATSPLPRCGALSCFSRDAPPCACAPAFRDVPPPYLMFALAFAVHFSLTWKHFLLLLLLFIVCQALCVLEEAVKKVSKSILGGFLTIGLPRRAKG